MPPVFSTTWLLVSTWPLFATGLEQFVEPLGALLTRLQDFNRKN